MKKLLYIFMAVAMVTACGKPDEPVGPSDDPGNTENPGDKPGDEPGDEPGDNPGDEKTLAQMLAGEWHCSPKDITADIYVSFVQKDTYSQEGTFELYQQITEGAYRLYRGTWVIADEEHRVLRGRYNDGNDWGSDYVISVGDNKLVMSAVNVTDKLEYEYERKEIPASVKENCVVEVKSSSLY